MQRPSHRSRDREYPSAHHRHRYSYQHKWILHRRMVDDSREHPACRQSHRDAGRLHGSQQDQHTAQRRREDLLRLRAQRDANAEFAQSLAHRV